MKPAPEAMLTTAPSTSGSRVTSVRAKRALPPAAAIFCTVSRPPASSRSQTSTRAPSLAKSSAVARPIPDAAPVTSALFPSTSRVDATAGAYPGDRGKSPAAAARPGRRARAARQLARVGALELADQEGPHPRRGDDLRERAHPPRALDAVDRVELRGELALVLEDRIGEGAFEALARVRARVRAQRLLELRDLRVGECARPHLAAE